MNGAAIITGHHEGRADGAPTRRFRQFPTTHERTATFAHDDRQHRHAVLSACAERLWPDADAAVDAAAGVLVAARLNREPARGGAAGPAGRPDAPARQAFLRSWLDRIVATLPEPRQRMYDLFVTRGLDSRAAAGELGATVAEVRRLRRENRDAIVRAFEVTALAAADSADPAGFQAPGCDELRTLLADAPDDGIQPADGRRDPAVLPAALRLTLSRHLSQCAHCQYQRDDRSAEWAADLLPLLADAELRDQVTADLQSARERGHHGAAAGAHRRPAPVRPGRKAERIVVIRPAFAAAGAGLVAALLLLAFVWPGLLRGTGAAADAAADQNKAVTSADGAPTAVGPVGPVPDGSDGATAGPATTGPVRAHRRAAAGSPNALSSAAVAPSAYYTLPPATPPASSPAPPTSSPTPSPSASRSRTASPTPTASTSTPTPTPTRSTSPTPTPTPSTPTPTPTTSTSSPTPTPSPSTAAPTTTPTATATATATATESAPPTTSASPTASSTAAPSESASA